MSNWSKKYIFIPVLSNEGKENFKGWWKRWWMWPVIIILVAVVVTLTCIVVFFPRERIVTVTDVRTVIKTVTKEVPVEVTKEVVKEVDSPALIAEVTRLEGELLKIDPPNLQENLVYITANEAMSALKMVFPNIGKGTVEKGSYGVVSQNDLENFFSYVENLSSQPGHRTDFIAWLGGKAEIWSQDAANGIVDPLSTNNGDTFAIFLFYDEQENIRVMGYNPDGAKGAGNFWVIERYPEAKFFLGLY
jgi:hypothetical protein